MRGVFPGSFDPLTVAHLAIADAAHTGCHLDELVLSISRVALGKEDGHSATVRERLRIIDAHRPARPWLRGRGTDAQLLADVAAGFDVLVLGADKWVQLHDPSFYASEAAMHAALARLPHVAVAHRDGIGDEVVTAAEAPRGVTVLDVPDWVGSVSSTAVRQGRDDWRATPG